MKKGFTLIELLAVIVILAIIALIATPIILGIINDARDEAKERTAELVVSSVELAYSTAFMDEGVEPTLEEVKNHFQMDNAVWSTDGTKITAENGVSCTVTAASTLSVDCGNEITTTVVMDLFTADVEEPTEPTEPTE